MLKRLKASTASRHAALEQRLPLLDAGLSKDTYLHYVQGLFGFYEPLEVQLLAANGWTTIGVDYAARGKTAQLRRDLRALGQTEACIMALPRCRRLPPVTDPAQLWGCLYVIEGATLGGQIILRHLNAHLGLTAEAGASFFDGYGRDTGRHWKAFCALVPGEAHYPATDHRAMLRSANLTFDLISEWLFPGSTTLDLLARDTPLPDAPCVDYPPAGAGLSARPPA